MYFSEFFRLSAVVLGDGSERGAGTVSCLPPPSDDRLRMNLGGYQMLSLL